MVIQELERSSSHLALGWSQAQRITFESSRLEDGVLQEDPDLFQYRLFRSIIKIRQCDMLKFTTYTCFKFHVYWFSVFGLTDLGFHEQIESKQVYMV